jgi:hypothetical protein
MEGRFFVREIPEIGSEVVPVLVFKAAELWEIGQPFEGGDAGIMAVKIFAPGWAV